MIKLLLKKYLNLKVKNKLLLSYFFIIMITVLLISMVNYNVSVSSIKNTSLGYSESLMNQIGINLQTRVKDMEEMTFMQYKSTSLNRYLRQESSEESYQMLMNFYYNNSLFEILYSSPYIQSVLVVKDGNKVFHAKRDGEHLSYDFLKNNKEDSEKLKGLWGRSEWMPGDKKTVFMKRALYDPETTEYLGYMVIGIDTKYISDIYNSGGSGTDRDIVIINDKDQVMVYNSSLSADISNYLLKGSRGESLDQWGNNFSFNGESYISAINTSSNSKWKVLNIIPVKTLTRYEDMLKYWILATCLISMLAAMVIAVLISDNISENVKLLLRSIREVAEGRFDRRIKPKSKDEIGLLAEEFNLMSEKIDTLMEKVAKEEALKNEAEYRVLEFQYNALQSQINPHFLYNTLESIRSMAKIMGAEKISNMVYLLGNIFRESISRKSKVVSLSQELKYIRNYLSIYKIMYGKKLRVKYETDENLNSAIVPNFIMQPIVENSIKYGIENKPGEGLITIRSYRNEDNLVLEVEDNGVGIDEIKLKELFDENTQQELKEKDRHTKVGLISVIKRIKLLYGDDYGLNVTTKLNEGTKVQLTIPLIIRQEDAVS